MSSNSSGNDFLAAVLVLGFLWVSVDYNWINPRNPFAIVLFTLAFAFALKQIGMLE
ncbi:MAG: hypothetical protein ACE5DI_00165 [Candidatus Micrarchaeia archaeon]